ncbi:hypothetical protein MUK42_10152 [Musa troglodytarum]|uniref:Uncharacterized protein n=1 Tax=Musa troglodytarum TaxID=320322 RepID=A0A9E7KCY6_9LILI|nr:hypothetical protein MUK42_10152 [Musa troglodytarum]
MYCNNSAEKWWAWAISDGWPWHFEELQDRRKGQRCGFGGPDDSGILFFVIWVEGAIGASSECKDAPALLRSLGFPPLPLPYLCLSIGRYRQRFVFSVTPSTSLPAMRPPERPNR